MVAERRWLDRDMGLSRLDRTRPRCRGECEDGVRPCPWVGCRYHLLFDTRPRPQDLGELRESCALDVADQGPHTSAQVGAILGYSRGRVWQIEASGRAKLRAAGIELPEDEDDA